LVSVERSVEIKALSEQERSMSIDKLEREKRDGLRHLNDDDLQW
jgi:hypothetical protein